MKFDFDSIPERRGTGCVKWDEAPEGVIPMWVADMDFKAAPFIIDALQKRLDHGVFGYSIVGEDYYQAVIDWFGRRRGWKIEKEWIIYTPGVIPSLSACVKAFTHPGDKVATHTPAYNHFFSSIRNNGCSLVECRLQRQGESFIIDFEQMEMELSDPSVKIFILCNPHNPTGRVWSEAELQQVGRICKRTSTILITDEIHCEIEMPGYHYTPYAVAALKDEEIAEMPYIQLSSPTKNFNIAGLQISNIICPSAEWRARIDRAVNDNEVCDVNPFGIAALKAAYSPEGQEWLCQMNAYVYDNYLLLRDTMKQEFGITVCELQGTYLAWIDCASLSLDTDQIQERLTNESGVWINGGSMYADARYMRINLATSHSLFREGLSRIVTGLHQLA